MYVSMIEPEESVSTPLLGSPKFSQLLLSQRKSTIFHLETYLKKRRKVTASILRIKIVNSQDLLAPSLH